MIDSDTPRRDEAIAWLDANAPAKADALLSLAYWAAVMDHAAEHVLEAGADARSAGNTWHVIGMAYGDRSPQAAQQKFSKAMAPNPPSS